MTRPNAEFDYCAHLARKLFAERGLPVPSNAELMDTAWLRQQLDAMGAAGGPNERIEGVRRALEQLRGG